MTELGPGTARPPRPSAPARAAALVLDLYRAERDVWRAHYKGYFKTAARVLGLGFVAGFAFFLLRPAQEKRALTFLLKSLGDIPLGAPPLVLALTLFYHNARASLLAVAAGGLPFLCLPILDPFVNGAALGLLASISKHQGLDVPLVFLKSVIPHGLFEVPAVLYATSAGLYLSVSLGRRVLARLRKRKAEGRAGAAPEPAGPAPTEGLAPDTGEPEAGVGSLVGQVARSFLLVVLPLLVVAAFVEAFITPLLR